MRSKEVTTLRFENFMRLCRTSTRTTLCACMTRTMTLLKSQIFGQHRSQGHRSGALEEVWPM
nr:MAG TPA: hypothetical protein [Caudoviricetes sp.]